MKKTRILAIVLSLCMLLALVPVAALADFTDIDEATNENYAGAIERWSDEGVISGVGNDAFNPKGTMSRVQGFGIIANLLKLSVEADLSEYEDAPTVEWEKSAVAKVVAAGIVKGYEEKTEDGEVLKYLKPHGELTREQMFVTIAKTLGVQPVETEGDEEFEDIGEAADYAAPYIRALHKMGAVNGNNGNVNPLDTLTREGAALLLDNLIGGYANTEGDTVEIEKGKITLVVADNVAVKGEITEEDMPIVVAGQAGTVDMKEVTGDVAPTVNVTVSDVTINDAPVGTEITATETAENVTANGIDVSADPDKDVVVPEPTPTPTPTPTPGGTVTSTPTLDQVISEEIENIDTEMDYADLTWDAVNHTLTVDITNGETPIGMVYTDIGTMLANAFNKARGNVSKVEDALNTGDNKATLPIDTDISNTTLAQFIPTLYFKKGTESKVLTDYLAAAAGEGLKAKQISVLSGGQFEINVTSTKPSGTTKYIIKFTPTLDDVIAEEIPSISQTMTEKGYASCTWDGTSHTLSVKITDGDTSVGTVYTDIAALLCEAFNETRTTLSTVKDALDGGTSELKDLETTPLTDSTLKTFVMGLKIKGSQDTVKTVMEVLGQSLKISGLNGYQFEINVTPKGQDEAVKYTISFTVEQ